MLSTIDVDNSGSRRDVDIHINVQIRDMIVIASIFDSGPGKNIINSRSNKKRSSTKFGGSHLQSALRATENHATPLATAVVSLRCCKSESDTAVD